MDRLCGRSAAGPMLVVAVAIRLIVHFVIEDGAVYNAAWLCPLIGFVLYLPIGFSIKTLLRGSKTISEMNLFLKILSAGAFVLLAFDAGNAAHLLSNTANVMALGEVPMWLVALPVALLAFVCAIFGMEACGRSSQIWIRVLLPLLAIMVIVQFRNYRTEWLTPLLGGGTRVIFDGAIHSAGYISLLSLPWLICTEDRCHRNIGFFVMLGALSAAAILAMLSMLSPALIHTTLSRSARIELVLSNGRVHLMLQLLMVVIWLVNLLHLLNAECSSAAVFLNNAFPNAPNWIFAAVAAVCIYLCAATGLAIRQSVASAFGTLLYPLLCFICLMLILFSIVKNRR